MTTSIIPRADNAVDKTMLRMYEKMGWWAQLKMNGTYSVITVRDGIVVETHNRRCEPHKAWKLTEDSAMIWREVPDGEWVFCAELMHSKVPGIRDTHYIHDVVVANGKPLLGTKYRERYQMLVDTFVDADSVEKQYYWELDSNTWLAAVHAPEHNDFKAMFEALSRPEEEGLVLKDPNGVLKMKDNNGWTVKCRRPTKNARC